MATFGESVLQGFLGAQGVRDYSHAAWTFWSNAAELIPRQKFLFHVYFNINTGQIPALQQVFGGGDQYTVGMMVKTTQVPGIKFEVETLNQYNRKRLVQTGLKYNPIQMTMHDDQGDLVRTMLYNYYSYYYKDPSQKYGSTPTQNGSLGQLGTMANGFGYNARDIYNQSRQVSDWGYIGESYQDSSAVTGADAGKPPFFLDIRIHGLSQKKFASWVMINPMITDWTGDTFDYDDGGGTMIHTLNIEYETMKFYTGAVGAGTPSNTVPGFADPAHYDNLKSPLARPGSRATVFGQGGLMDAAGGFIQDLEDVSEGRAGAGALLGGVQMAATAWYTFRGQNLASFAYNELQADLPMIIRQGLPQAARLVPNSPNSQFYPYSAFPNGSAGFN